MTVNSRTIRYDFRGAGVIPASAGEGPFVKADTSSGGSPTVQGVSGGGVALALDATNEVQNLCLYMGDVLPFDIDDVIRMSFVAKITASLDSAITAVMGLGSARNDDPDSVAQAALFKLAGSNTLVVESDDGTNDNDDVSTGGATLSTTFKRFAIDFATGVLTQSPPALSKGGKGSVQFYVDNSKGSLQRVGKGTNFDMSNYAGNLQPIFQLQKTASTAVATLTILEVELEVKIPA